MKFFDAIANVFRIPDLRKRVLFTLALLAVYRLGGHIPTPGINLIRWEEFFERNAGGGTARLGVGHGGNQAERSNQQKAHGTFYGASAVDRGPSALGRGPWTYSYFSASTGCTPAARRAGR